MVTRPAPGKTDNLAELENLTEETLLAELRVRYNRDTIYTYVGEILVTVNPYKWVQGLYSQTQANNYTMVTDKTALPPHLFATADMAYQQLTMARESQSCVISGESGAGKTEAAKLFVQQLIHVCNGCEVDGLHTKLVDVNPLLEAFGNAQTLMNDNSSRFGKFTEITFNPRKGVIRGASMKNYLLEKSRVVYQAPGEQNFHIFYLLFAGLGKSDDRMDFDLREPSFYRCVNSNAAALKGISTQKTQNMVEELTEVLQVVGFTDEQREDMWAILSGILHLANLEFFGEDAVRLVSDNSLIAAICNQLEVDEGTLELALTRSIILMRGEETERAYKLHQAEDCRDAAVKSIYERLFSWLFRQCNNMLRLKNDEDTDRFVGILDIFGFECFDHNSFEQLCINLANEQLQYFFNDHIFRMELAEYAKEGIDGAKITYDDNQPLLDLMLQKRGLISLLDEESNFPRGTDDSFVLKMHNSFTKHRDYQRPMGNEAVFSLRHYAGLVEYDAASFLEKNRDRLAVDVISMLRDSDNSLLAKLFGGSSSRKRRDRKRAGNGGAPVDVTVSDKMLRASMKRVRESLAKTKKFTVAYTFKASLSELMTMLNRTSPHFIRCIKPNEFKLPGKFSDSFVTRQLRYTGMLETTRIRREGYSHRPFYADFVRQYIALAWTEPDVKTDRHGCEVILRNANIQGHAFGRTKIFLRYWHIDKLNDLARPMMNAALVFQRTLRGMVGRNRVRRLYKAAIKREEQLAADFLNLERRGGASRDIVLSLCEADARRPLAFWARRQSKDAIPEQVGRSRRRESKVRQHDAAVRWYKEQEKGKGAGQDDEGDNQFAKWFHGVISRKDAQDLLCDKPSGTFLVRVAESRFGYSLSLIHEGEVKHFMIDLKDDFYILVGNRRKFKSLRDVVQHHKSHMVTGEGDLLIYPCEGGGARPDLDELK